MSVRRKALCFAVVAGMGLLVNACTQTYSTPAQETAFSNNEPATAGETAMAAEMAPDAAQIVPSQESAPPQMVVQESQELFASSKVPVGLMLERGDSFTTIVMNTGGEEPPVEVLTLENPKRLVVDLVGERSELSTSVGVEDDPFVQSVRIGAHPNKTRIVFDLSEMGENVEHTVSSEDGRVQVTFAERGVYGEQALGAYASEDAPADGVMAAQPELPVLDGEAEEGPEMLADMQVEGQTAQAEQYAQENGGFLSLETLTFERGWDTSGQIQLVLTEEAAFELKQTAPSEYVLTIPGATASENTTLPQIAPRGFPGIRAARAVEEGSAVKVRMFVDSGVSLQAFPRGKQIVVEAHASAQMPADDPSARAQAQLLEVEELQGSSLPREAAAPPSEEAVDEAPGDGAGEDTTARRNPTGIRSADGSKIYTGRLISLDLQDTDIDNALRIIAEVSNLNIIASDDVSGKVTLRLIDVPWDQALDVILKTNGLDQVTEGNVIRIAPVDKLRQEREALREAKRAAQNLEDLTVQYVRVSYARVDEMREQVESVLSERGTIAVDERTNQLIVKDIRQGHEEAIELIKRLDLRTPQVLLETQIVEGQRNMLRDLGFQWNYNYIQSPGTGNPTGEVFPNSITVAGGTNDGDNSQSVNFPAVLTDAAGSAVTAILDSADGTRSLTARLSALETEGRVRVISRPQVATVNNKQAEIKSVETIRVRVPGSGTSIATGAGAAAQGGGATAFEEIDIGIELRVTPQASPDYYVLLDVDARSSAFGSTVVDNIPSTIEREATSTILVKSGQTFALGGVYRINDTDQIQGVPWLKDIPFVGTVFRRTFVDKSDEELIFFITPHIVEGSFDPSIM